MTPANVRIKAALLSIDQVDDEVLKLVGRVALRHAHLDYELRLTIKTISGEDYLSAIAKTERKMIFKCFWHQRRNLI